MDGESPKATHGRMVSCFAQVVQGRIPGHRDLESLAIFSSVRAVSAHTPLQRDLFPLWNL